MNARRALLLFAAYVATQLGTGVAMGIVVAVAYGARHDRAAADALRATVLVGGALGLVCAGACVFLLVRRMLRGDPQGLRAIGWAPTTRRSQAIAALAGIALGFLYAFVLARYFPLAPEVKMGPIAQAVSDGGWKLYVWVVLALFIAPPIEEFVFRGALWTGLRRSWGPVPAAIVVTALFVVMHMLESGRYPPALFAIASLGLACIVARSLTGSLVASIALHMAYNAVIVTATMRQYG